MKKVDFQIPSQPSNPPQADAEALVIIAKLVNAIVRGVPSKRLRPDIAQLSRQIKYCAMGSKLQTWREP
jgi:hypothetical protein